jgi:transcriptional regulator with XRE-family HTH domain
MTQKQLADRNDMSVPVISRLERTDSDPRVSTVRRIADATGASLDAIINGPAVPAAKAKRAPQGLRAEIRAARQEIAAALKRLDAIEASIAPKRRPASC